MNTNTFLSHHFFPSHSSGLKEQNITCRKARGCRKSVNERKGPTLGRGGVEGAGSQCGHRGWKAGSCSQEERTGAQDLTELLWCISPERELAEAPSRTRCQACHRDSKTVTQSPGQAGPGSQDRGQRSWQGQTRCCWRVKEVWGGVSFLQRRQACVLSHSFNRFLLNQ